MRSSPNGAKEMERRAERPAASVTLEEFVIDILQWKPKPPSADVVTKRTKAKRKRGEHVAKR